MKLISNQNVGGGVRHSRLLGSLIFIALLFSFSCKNQTNNQTQDSNTPLSSDEIAITVAGDSNVKLDLDASIKVPKNSTWASIKDKVNKKLVGFNAGFELKEWHITNKDGEVLVDAKVFNENATVFAVSRAIPTPEAVRWQAAFCSDGTTYAIRNDGSLWVCGWNDDKQTGLGIGTQMISTLTRVGTDTDWKYASGGQGYVFLLKTDGSLWAIGLSDKGVQGTNASVPNKVPTKIGTDTDWMTVTSGKFSSKNGFAIKNNGEIWGWGDNLFKIVIGQTKNVITTPQKLALEGKWKDVSTGLSHVLAIKEDGTLWSWGSNFNKATGVKDAGKVVKVATQIGSDNDWVKVRAITSRSYAIKSDGSLWACGSNPRNLVGLNQTEGSVDDFIIEFTKINMIQGKVIDVLGDENTTIVACGENGEITEIYAWGLNADGALGDDNGKLLTQGSTIADIPYSTTPVKVLLPEGFKYSMISSGQGYSLALTREGKLYGWGRNKGGQLGDKTDLAQLKTSFYKKPIEIKCPKD